MLTFALTSAFSSPRHLEWKLEDAESKKTLFYSSESSEHALNSSPHHRQGAWEGDALSRLIFYSSELHLQQSNRRQLADDPELLVSPMVELGPSATVAYDIPWNVRLRQSTPRDIELPEPCINGICGTWSRVRSVDLGKCSIELSYGRPAIPSELLGLLAGDYHFLDNPLLNAIHRNQCISDSKDDRRNFRTNSRWQERFLRGHKRTAMGGNR